MKNKRERVLFSFVVKAEEKNEENWSATATSRGLRLDGDEQRTEARRQDWSWVTEARRQGADDWSWVSAARWRGLEEVSAARRDWAAIERKTLKAEQI